MMASSGWMQDFSGRERGAASALREDSDASSQFMVNTWKSSEGLPANEIQSLRETADGYLWMGTHQGLVRFDGIRFQTFFSTPAGNRYGTRVDPLEVDERGRLWSVPDQIGLVFRDDRAFIETQTNGAVLRARAENLCSDGTNWIMWVDATGGLGRISTKNPQTAEALNGGGSAAGSSWQRDFEGQLWLVNPRGLKLYREGQWQDVPVPGAATLVATPRREGGLWIAREARLRYVTAAGKAHDAAQFPWRGQTRVHCMLEDSHHRLWIGTVAQGLYCYANGEFQQVVPTASSINCLFEGSQENLWVGTRGGGLLRVRQRFFFMHDLNTGLKSEFVRSLAQDPEGRMWLTTAESGLGWWRKGEWHPLTEAEGWGNMQALSVCPARGGGAWISTSRRTICRWNEDKLTTLSLGKRLPREAAMDLLEDKKGRLWMVTDNWGIYLWDGTNLVNYSVSDGLPSSLIRRVAEDEAGGIWAGDWEGGIARFKEDRWEIVRKPSGHADAVRSMVVAEGTVWIGTSAGGLLRFKDGQTARISVEQGLPDASIRQLLLESRDALWGGTPHRLFRVSVAQLNSVMDGRATHIDAVSYGHSDGLPDLSFASWCDPRCWRTSSGELWFATANGAIHFYPQQLREESPPHAVLESTLVNGKPISTERLRPGAGRVEFYYTAPCLTAPERVRFRYRLSGVDNEWVDADTTRTATYASLPAGAHEFQVVASSPEGKWSTEPAMISLRVYPYFWQTSWFLALVTAGLAGGTVWLIRHATVLRLRSRLAEAERQRAVDRERTRIAQDIHDELGASLTRIGLLADIGVRHKTDPRAVATDLGQISATARESVAAMDAIVWALNPRNDSLDHFANYLAQYTREFFQPTNLRTRLDLPTNLPAEPLDSETRHEMFLLVKEAFNNIVRHAQASEVHVSLACADNEIRLVIADNGKGLAAQTAESTGNGLSNLRERIQRMGGSLRIESHNGHGVKLDFTLPLLKLRRN